MKKYLLKIFSPFLLTFCKTENQKIILMIILLGIIGILITYTILIPLLSSQPLILLIICSITGVSMGLFFGKIITLWIEFVEKHNTGVSDVQTKF
jgi:predicted MFS family arabinose efflux permease